MYTFRKEEKICSKKLTDALYLNGLSFINYPFRISYLKQELNTIYPAQVLFIVSKKRYKRAHDRNRIKRLMRESYRLIKNELYIYLMKNNLNLIFSINYIASEEQKFEFIQKNMQAALQKIMTQLDTK